LDIAAVSDSAIIVQTAAVSHSATILHAAAVTHSATILHTAAVSTLQLSYIQQQSPTPQLFCIQQSLTLQLLHTVAIYLPETILLAQAGSYFATILHSYSSSLSLCNYLAYSSPWFCKLSCI
jgi:GDP-D-mannose dehydratase